MSRYVQKHDNFGGPTAIVNWFHEAKQKLHYYKKSCALIGLIRTGKFLSPARKNFTKLYPIFLHQHCWWRRPDQLVSSCLLRLGACWHTLDFCAHQDNQTNLELLEYYLRLVSILCIRQKNRATCGFGQFHAKQGTGKICYQNVFRGDALFLCQLYMNGCEILKCSP